VHYKGFVITTFQMEGVWRAEIRHEDGRRFMAQGKDRNQVLTTGYISEETAERAAQAIIDSI
jgi:hypothetical protein